MSQLGAYAAYGTTPASIAWGMLTHPLQVLSEVFSRQNFTLLVYLFAPVLFLPFLSPRYLLPVVPLQVLYLAGDVSDSVRYGPQAVAIVAFIFLSTPRGLSRLGRRNIELVTVDRRLLITMAAAALAFSILYSPSSPYDRPWDWGGQDAADGARLDAERSIPKDASVRASTSMLVPLAEREHLYALDVGSGDVPVADPSAAADGVDVVVLDRREFDGPTAFREPRPGGRPGATGLHHQLRRRGHRGVHPDRPGGLSDRRAEPPGGLRFGRSVPGPGRDVLVVPAGAQRVTEALGGVVELGRFGVAGRVGEVEVVDPGDGHHVKVHVGHLEAGDHAARPSPDRTPPAGLGRPRGPRP